jgi:hypothetical protein
MSQPDRPKLDYATPQRPKPTYFLLSAINWSWLWLPLLTFAILFALCLWQFFRHGMD